MLAGMELRQLRYFVAVAEEGNISRAAKKIFLTQPALSRQIKALEEEIGQCLLERQAHSIRLTPAGETLLAGARELLDHAGRVLDGARAAGRVLRLRVGYAPSLASGWLSQAVAVFSQAHPSARVELFDLSTQEMLAGLEAGSLDVAITVRPNGDTRGLNWVSLVQASWRLAVGCTHAFARRSRVTPAEVATQPLLVFCQRDYPEYWELVTGWLRAHHERPRVAGEHDGVDSLMAAVGSGLGVALVTLRAGHLVPEGVRLVRLASPPGPLCIAAGCRTGRETDKPLATFVAELRHATARLPDGAGIQRAASEAQE